MDNAVLIADEKACKKICEMGKTIWTKEKLMACLKRLVHQDVFTKISKVDVLQFTTTQKFDNFVVLRYLQHLIRKPDSRLQMYCKPFGTVNGLLFNLIEIQKMPLFYKYVNLPRSTYYYSNANMITGKNDMKFLSKSDIILLIYRNMEIIIGEKEAKMVCSTTFERLEKSYELVPESLAAEILHNLNRNVDANYIERFFNDLEEKCVTPVVRQFHGVTGDWFFAKEVELAIKAEFKERNSGKTLPEGVIRLDNDEDRALGVLHIVELKTMEKLLKSLNLKLEDLNIISFEEESPFISPYGSHCNFAMYSVEELTKSFTLDLGLFQRVKRAKLPKITKWLGNQDVFFDEKRTYRFMVESWKLDEIKEKASIKFKRLCTEPIYNIPVKSSFTMLEIIDELKKFSPNIHIEKDVIGHLKGFSSGSVHSYSEVCDAFINCVSPKYHHRDTFKRFTNCQMGNVLEFVPHFAPHIINAIQEKDLPPSVKFGKNDLGEVLAPKSKKNIKPDFSKKIDKEAVMMKALKCFNQHFEKFQSFEIENLKEYFDEGEWEYLKEVLKNEEKRKDIEKVFDIVVEDKIYILKRKGANLLTTMIIENIENEKALHGKVEKLENEQKSKDTEIERLNKQISDTVQQSIEKIRKSKAELEKEIQELQNKLETAMKKVAEAEKSWTAQLATVKQGYREELSKLKEDNDVKNAKNEKLQKELKESREELRKEREKKNIQIDEDLKKAGKSMERMKKELENLKLWKTAKTKEISELERENESLKTQLEIAEGKKHVEEPEEEMDKENEQLQKMTEKLERIPL